METHWRYKNLWVIRESMCEANSWQTRGRQKNGPQSCFSAVGIEKKKDRTRTFHEEDLLFTFWVSEEKWPNFLYNCLNHNDLSLQFSTPGTLFKSMSVIAYKILITNKRPRKSLLLQDCVDWSGAPRVPETVKWKKRENGISPGVIRVLQARISWQFLAGMTLFETNCIFVEWMFEIIQARFQTLQLTGFSWNLPPKSHQL